MKKIYLAISISFLLIVILIGLGLLTKKPLIKKQAPNKKELTDYVSNRAQYQYNKKHYQVLIAAQEKIVLAAPESKQAKTKLAKLYYDLSMLEQENNDKAEAEKNFSKAIELDPKLIKH